MGVGREPRMIAEFMTEVLQVFLGESTLDVSSCVHAGRGVSLVVNEIAGLIAVGGVEEVVLTYLYQGRQGGIGRDVSADIFVVLVRSNNHRESVPANVVFDGSLNLAVSGVRKFFIDGNGVDVGGVK